MTSYDPSKYLSDPQFPEYQCSICDEERTSIDDLIEHLRDSHDINQLAYQLSILQDYTWRMEQLIRKLTGKQSYEVLQEQSQ